MFGLPPRNVAQIKRLATHLTRRHRRTLFGISGFLLIMGYVNGVWMESPTVLPRYGALMTLLTLWHAYVQFRYITMLDLQAVPFAMEFAKSIGKEETAPELLLGLRAGTQRRFILDHLAAASLGTLTWGFADLLPLAKV
jgi:hypothetical protein